MKRILAMLLCLCMIVSVLPVQALGAEIGIEETTVTVIPEAELPDSDELYEGFLEQLFYGGNAEMFGIAAGERLTGNEKILYDALVPVIREIALGNRASTVITVGKETTTDSGKITPDAGADFTGTDLNMDVVLDALLTDLPFELYWFDKGSGCTISYYKNSTDIVLVRISFEVAANYGADCTVDTAKTARAVQASAKAQTIMENAVGRTDYEKLLYYKEQICELVSYDETAASSGSYSTDNDPWQLVSVFDGDNTTNVVCEGYSKAFQYLCDLTTFQGDVTCYTVTGKMTGATGGGDHMWNVVTIDGGHYLVDVTNSDSGTVGSDGTLFLVTASGSAADGYTAANGCKFTYDTNTKTLWGTGEDSILTLASANYDPNANQPLGSGTCGTNLTWVLDSKGTLTISGTGGMKNYGPGGVTPWYADRDKIKTIVIESGVTSIGIYAFCDIGCLESVTIPESVISIGEAAFAICSSLTSVKIPSGVTSIEDSAFKRCSSLASVEIPSGVTSIKGSAFYGCSALTSVTIPASVTSIKGSAFYGCSALTSVTIPASVTSIGYSAFDSCSSLTSVAIPSGVTNIGESAFRNCSSLTGVEIPSGVTNIGDSAFSGCSGMETVRFLGDMPTIAYNSFENVTATAYYPKGNTTWDGISSGYGGTLTWVGEAACVASGTCGEELTWTLDSDGTLTISGTGAMTDYALATCAPWYADRAKIQKVVIESGVTSIGEYAFYNCTSLKSVTIPSGVTSIGNSAFGYCINLTSVEIPVGVTSIGDTAFSSCRSLTSVEIPSGVTCIGYSAFEGCSGLKSVTIPATVTSIKSCAFSDCSNLTSVELPAAVTIIGWGAFSGCSSLESVTIPASVADIADDVFRDCTGIKVVRFLGEKPFIGDNSFKNVTATAVYPKGYTTWDGISSGYGGTLTWESEILCVSSGAYGENLTWTLDSEGTLTISGTGEMENYSQAKDVPWYADRAKIRKVVIESGVTSIGEYAFYGCTNLTGVEIPVGVTSIGYAAFAGCSNLTSVEIPSGVTSIGRAAFSSCSGLTSVIIPKGVTSIGQYAFHGCTGLTSVTIPSGVTRIESYAFGDCSGLTDVTIPAGVTSIGVHTFSSCSSLKSVTIPASVTSIESGAFYNCSSLTSVTIPEDVTSIGDSCTGTT